MFKRVMSTIASQPKANSTKNVNIKELKEKLARLNSIFFYWNEAAIKKFDEENEQKEKIEKRRPFTKVDKEKLQAALKESEQTFKKFSIY